MEGAFNWIPPVSFSWLLPSVRSSLLPRAPYAFRPPGNLPPTVPPTAPTAAAAPAAPPPSSAPFSAAFTDEAMLPPPPPFSTSTASSFSKAAFHARMLDLSAGLGGLSVAAAPGPAGGDVVARAQEALAALEAAQRPRFDSAEEARRVMRLLTGEEEARVRGALATADPTTRFSFIDGNHFTALEAAELKPRVWLTDGTINVFLMALRALGEAALAAGPAADHRRVYTCNTFFWAKLQGETGRYGYDGVSSWTRAKGKRKGVDLFAYKKVLVPINRDRTHWALAVIDVEARTVAFLDSLRGRGGDVVEALCKYMSDEWADKHQGQPLPGEPFTGAPAPPLLPIQRNGVDCGAFLCAFCELLVRGVEPTEDVFTQENIGYWRQRILLTCLGQGGAPRVLDTV